MLIDKKLIIMDIEARSKIDVIRTIATFALKADKLSSLDGFIEDVLEREKDYSTGIGEGIAIPHAKSKSAKEAVIVFGKLKEKVDWGSMDGKPVEAVFLFGVPEENANNLHLKLLSQLSRKLMDEDFVKLLKASRSEDEIFEALKDIGESK